MGERWKGNVYQEKSFSTNIIKKEFLKKVFQLDTFSKGSAVSLKDRSLSELGTYVQQRYKNKPLCFTALTLGGKD